ncbi:hypothetical protein GC173_00655 [bacterium]|nr:hypothetical protein [bacterium]
MAVDAGSPEGCDRLNRNRIRLALLGVSVALLALAVLVAYQATSSPGLTDLLKPFLRQSDESARNAEIRRRIEEARQKYQHGPYDAYLLPVEKFKIILADYRENENSTERQPLHCSSGISKSAVFAFGLASDWSEEAENEIAAAFTARNSACGALLRDATKASFDFYRKRIETIPDSIRADWLALNVTAEDFVIIHEMCSCRGETAGITAPEEWGL